MKIKGNKRCLERNAVGWKRANAQRNIFSICKKINYDKKTIRELRLEDESTTINDKQILDQIENYFRDLHTSVKTFSQDEFDEFTQHLQIPKLSDEDRDSLEGPLSYEECKNVLESFQNDKSPGEDGFTVEFYKIFWHA